MPKTLSRLLFFSPFFWGVLLCTRMELGVDESHYMLYARHLDWSYFDHPPLVGWVHALFNWFLKEDLFSARVPALFVGLFCQIQTRRFLQELGYSATSAFWGALAYGFSTMFFALHFLLLPDSLLLFLFWPLLARAVTVSQRPEDFKAWLWLGIYLGLVGLSKYTGVLYVLPVTMMIFQRQGFGFLRRPGFYGLIFVAAAMVSPVFYWNYHHDWISFRFQTQHVLGGAGGSETFVKSLAAQWAFVGPALWPLAFLGLFGLWRSQHQSAGFAFWTVVGVALFFVWSSFREVVLPHWPAQAYALAVPVGVAMLFEYWPGWARALVAFSGLIVLGLGLFVLTPLGAKSPALLKEFVGWREGIPRVMDRLLTPEDRVVVLNWTYGSRAKFWSRDREHQILIVDSLKDQYDLWGQERLQGQDVWLLQWSYDLKAPEVRSNNSVVFENRLSCSHLSEEEHFPVVVFGQTIYELVLTRCYGATEVL